MARIGWAYLLGYYLCIKVCLKCCGSEDIDNNFASDIILVGNSNLHIIVRGKYEDLGVSVAYTDYEYSRSGRTRVVYAIVLMFRGHEWRLRVMNAR